MTRRAKIALGVAAAIVVAAVAFFLLVDRGSLPVVGKILEPPKCPLTGEKPQHEKLLDQPAIAVKIENNPAAYPLSGLEHADIVYEELVEGGYTRFMAIYHCANDSQVGPIRSARIVDPAIMSPITHILADAGGNPAVRETLKKADIYSIDETVAGDAMRRVSRPGVASEHTLYGNTVALRKLGKKRFDEAPPDDLFSFGDLQSGAKKAKTITIVFSGANVARYSWQGGSWARFQGDSPLLTDENKQITVDNVLIEQHTINLSATLGDVRGTPSTEIADVVGSGRAALFRDGRVLLGKWTREDKTSPVVFETKSGDEMVLHPGRTWIEIVPSSKGEVKGSFSYEK